MKRPDDSWGTYLRHGVGRRLSMLGEKLNIHWLIYNPIHFRHFHEEALANAPQVIQSILAVMPDAKTFVDIGAGTGVFSAELQKHGRQVVACERSPTGRKLAAQQGVDIRPFDLMQNPPARLDAIADVSICFEVAEHLPPALGDKLVAFISHNSQVAIFTAAHPGQGGTGHINEQPKSYWIERFHGVGMIYDEALSDTLTKAFIAARVPGKWFHDNLIVCRRSS